MKILLLEHPRSINPERCNDIANTPLSSCLLSGYAAAMLAAKGHEVDIVEGYLEGLSYREIESRIKSMQPDILGLHMVYHWQDDLALFAFLERVKTEGLARYITAYGFYPTIAFEDILHKCSAVDSVILGEPELTFAELAEAVSGGAAADRHVCDRAAADRAVSGQAAHGRSVSNKSSYAGVPGLAIRDASGTVSYTRRELAADLDLLPFPVRTEAMFRLPEVNLQGSRGCYGGCTFCYINPFYGQGSRWRGRSPENIIAEIDAIITEHGTRDFYFTDPNFFGPGQKGQARALHLASLLKSRDIRFGIEARVNDIHPETIAPLVEAGLRHILIGLESGRDSSLKRLNKMTTVAQNERAVKILREHGIEPNIGFIMFEPDSSLEDVRTNFEFLRRNDLLKNLAITANLLYHHQIVLKGTPAYQNLLREGRLHIQSSTYEGTTAIADPSVAVLASIMRQITNFLFDRMAGIWGGKVEEPRDAQERYAKINSLLVDTFEASLKALEAGEQLTDVQLESLIQRTKQEIAEMLTH